MNTPAPVQSQFEQLYSALADRYPMLKDPDGRTTMFQFSSSPTVAAWRKGTDYEAYCVANTVSERLDGFYVPSAGSLTSAYRTFIHALQPARHDQNDEYRALQRQLDDLNNERDGTSKQMQVAFITYKQQNNPPPTSAEWMADPMGGADYKRRLDRLDAKIQDLGKQVADLVSAMDGPLGTAQKDFDNDDYKAVYITGDNRSVKYPRIALEGDLDHDRSNWDGYPPDQNDFTAVLKGRAETTTPWRTVYKTTMEADCWGASSKTTVNTSRVIADSDYEMKVDFKGLAAYKVHLGEWFSPSYVNPDTARFPQGSTVNADTFFGAKGSLHTIPDVIWVAYRPTIRLTVSTKLFRQEFEANADVDVRWIDLLGFRFGFNGLGSLQPEGKGEVTTMTIKSPDTADPYVLGVVSSIRYNGSEEQAAPLQEAVLAESGA